MASKKTKVMSGKSDAKNDEAPMQQADLDNALLKAAQANSMQCVEELLDKGANANYQYSASVGWDSVVDCPLHHAVKHNNLDMARLLMSKGAKTDRKFGSSGWSRGIQELVFDEMCRHENSGFLGLALEFGADPNAKISHGTSSMRTDRSTRKTSLHTMVEAGQVEKVRLLLEAKADANARMVVRVSNERGYSSHTDMPALCLAIRDRQPLVSLLLHHKADPNLLCTSTKHIDNPDYNADEDDDDPRSGHYTPPVMVVNTTCTALHLAIQVEDSDLLWQLLFIGADPSATATVAKGVYRANHGVPKTTADFLKEAKDSVQPLLRQLVAFPPTRAAVGEILHVYMAPDVANIVVTYLV